MWGVCMPTYKVCRRGSVGIYEARVCGYRHAHSQACHRGYVLSLGLLGNFLAYQYFSFVQGHVGVIY